MSAIRGESPDTKEIDIEAYPVELKSDAQANASPATDDEISEPKRSWKEAVQSLSHKDSWIGDYVSRWSEEDTAHLIQHISRIISTSFCRPILSRANKRLHRTHPRSSFAAAELKEQPQVLRHQCSIAYTPGFAARSSAWYGLAHPLITVS